MLYCVFHNYFFVFVLNELAQCDGLKNGLPSKNVFFFRLLIADFDAMLTKFWVNGTRGQNMLFPQCFIPPFEVLMQENLSLGIDMYHIS